MAFNETAVKELITDGRLPRDSSGNAPSEAAVEAAHFALDMIRNDFSSYTGKDGGVAEAVALKLSIDPGDKEGFALRLLTEFFARPENDEKIQPVAVLAEVQAEPETVASAPVPLTPMQKLVQRGLKDRYAPKLPSHGGLDTPG